MYYSKGVGILAYFGYEYSIDLRIVSEISQYLHSLFLRGLTINEISVQFTSISPQGKHNIRENDELVIASKK